jgi:hypothetical protein
MAQFGTEDITQDIVETPKKEEVKTVVTEVPEQQAPVEPVVATTQIDQDPPSKALWKALSSNEYGNLYTKSCLLYTSDAADEQCMV